MGDLISDMEDLTSVGCMYYEVEEFNRLMGNLDQLFVFHQNIRSFNSNFDTLSCFLSKLSHNVDVLVLTETWFREGLCCSIDGYKSYHTYRNDKSGGGVSVYVRKNLHSVKNLSFSNCSDAVETCVVEINPDVADGRNSIVIIGMYRPPKSSLQSFVECSDSLLRQFSRRSFLCAGDINIDLLDEEASGEFCNSMYSYDVFPLVNIPTRITDDTAKCLDHIWYNKCNVVFSGSFVADISDHYPVFAVLNVTRGNRPQRKVIRDLSCQNINSFISVMPIFVREFNLMQVNSDVNGMTEWFILELSRLYDKHCPKKTKTVSRSRYYKPWLTDQLIERINNKHRLFKKYKLGVVSFSVYREINNRLSKMIKKAKANYYSRKLLETRSDIKKTWKTINSITNRTKSKSNDITLVDGEGGDVYESGEISNMFCNYFSSVATDLNNNIPDSNTNPMNYMPPRIRDSFFVAPSTATEIKKLVLSLPNKGFTVNSIPVFIYKKIIDFVAPIFSSIFNRSVSEGIFPDILKIARITPIYKGKSHKVVSNFRPISVLSFTSKILEKLMKYRVVKYLESNSIIYDKQFGFREGYSTTDAVLEFVDSCTSSLDNKLFTIAVFLDLSKAFDTVNRDIMLNKLDNLGFRGIANQWFASYLSDRKMYVQYDKSTSVTKTLNIGLPQGAVSSPWLFSLYVNDMHRVSDKLTFVHFADDTTVHMSGSNLRKLCLDMSEELVGVNEWMNANRLSLNVEKTSFMLFTHSTVKREEVVISIGGRTVQQVRSAKFLGITIDDRLNFNQHTSILCRRLSCAVGVMYRMSVCVPGFVLRMLYFSLFYPHLIYGVSVWGGCGITNISKVKRIQNKALSIIAENGDNNLPLPFHKVYLLYLMCKFQSIFHNGDSEYFLNKVNLLIPAHQHQTRFCSLKKINVARCDKTVSQRQFFYNGVRGWNDLPHFLKDPLSPIQFKSKLKKHLYAS